MLAELAARQHGRFATWQLGGRVSATQLRRRVEAERLHREHHGVYAVGHPGATDDARRMAATLAAGPRALLSHWALCHHLELLYGDPPTIIDVTVAGRDRSAQPGLRFHLPRVIMRSETMRVRGVPCTTVERLLADMAAGADDDVLATLVHRAQVRRLTRPERMAFQFARAPAGIGRLRELWEPDGPDLRQKFEKRFHRFVRAGDWPAYEANVRLWTPLGPMRPDALWREFGFALELDSWQHHGDRGAFETDRERVLAADAVGIDLKRVTWRMLTGTPDVLAALLDRRVGRDGRPDASPGPISSTNAAA